MGMTLEVQIISASNVNGVYPFVVVCFDNDLANEVYKTEAVNGGALALWNEKFTIDLTQQMKRIEAENKPEPKYLTFFMYDTGVESIPLLGSAGVLLSTVKEKGENKGDFPVVHGTGTMALIVKASKEKWYQSDKAKIAGAVGAVGVGALAAGLTAAALNNNKKKKNKSGDTRQDGGAGAGSSDDKKKKKKLTIPGLRELTGGGRSSNRRGDDDDDDDDNDDDDEEENDRRHGRDDDNDEDNDDNDNDGGGGGGGHYSRRNDHRTNLNEDHHVDPIHVHQHRAYFPDGNDDHDRHRDANEDDDDEDDNEHTHLTRGTRRNGYGHGHGASNSGTTSRGVGVGGASTTSSGRKWWDPDTDEEENPEDEDEEEDGDDDDDDDQANLRMNVPTQQTYGGGHQPASHAYDNGRNDPYYHHDVQQQHAGREPSSGSSHQRMVGADDSSNLDFQHTRASEKPGEYGGTSYVIDESSSYAARLDA